MFRSSLSIIALLLLHPAYGGDFTFSRNMNGDDHYSGEVMISGIYSIDEDGSLCITPDKMSSTKIPQN